MEVLKEEWVDAVGFESFYEVSNKGRVRRKKGETVYKDGRVARFSQTILKQGKDDKGYHRVYLSVGSVKKTVRVHRLVALSFIPNLESKKTVNHIDGDKSNNYVHNLEWMTNTENMRHAFEIGLYDERNKYCIRNIRNNTK